MTTCSVTRRFPLAAVHNQINPLTKITMILLRLAIGWHVLYEGYTKYTSTVDGRKPFSAEMYLRNSVGPLRFHFRGLIDDFHGLALLDADPVAAKWKEYTDSIPVDADARQRLDETRSKLEKDLREYLTSKKDDIDRYKTNIEEFEGREQRPLPGFGHVPGGAENDQEWVNVLIDASKGKLLRPKLPNHEWEYQKKLQKELDKTRAELTGPIMKWSDDLVAAARHEMLTTGRDALKSSGAQVSSSAPAAVPRIVWKPQLDLINKTTMWGLIITGSLLMVGLFTRTACLGAVFLLSLFYLSMPPWPGLDPAPIAEGNYLIVNKNLIELVALLMLASSPVGVWGGLDSFIRGLITRPIFGVGKKEVLASDD